MRLLLDTHTVLWWFADDLRLSTKARAEIAAQTNQLVVSAVVAYEIVYKQNIGRLSPLPEPLQNRLRREGIQNLPISFEHAIAAAELPGPHRDPWDRIMIAQAMTESLTVITVDAVFDDYGVPTLW